MEDDIRKAMGIDLLVPEEPLPVKVEPIRAQQAPGLILGMTAPQRFVISVLLFILTFLFGTFVLLVADKIAIPL